MSNFTRFVLNIYDEKFNDIFITGCCQQSPFKLGDFFIQKASFMACVRLRNKDGSWKTYHKFFPVMVGSRYHLNRYPNDRDRLENSWGSFIIGGELKILANILLNNINIFYANKKQFLWNIDANTQITYKNGQVYKDGEVCTNWRQHIPDSCESHSETMYKELFEEIWENFPHIDHLSNKIILTAPILLERVLLYLQTDAIRPKIATKRDLLTNGNITFIFSKQPFSRQSQKITHQMAIEKKNVSIYISVDGHKIGRIKHLVTTTKRMIPQESMNSQPLQYPPDGDLFICLLSCKEMKDAGLTLNLARLVVVTREVDIEVEKIKLLEFFAEFIGEFHLVVNCIIQPIMIDFNFNIYLLLKSKFINCSVFKYRRFIHILFIENVPVVSLNWMDRKVYVTPNENRNLFYNELRPFFEEADYFCALYGDLSRYTTNSLATKKTVSLNNWRGACYNNSVGKDSAEYAAFIHSPGYNTEIIGGGQDYTHLAIMKNPLFSDISPDTTMLRPYQRGYIKDTLHKEHGEILLYVGFTMRGSCVEDGFVVDREFVDRGPRLRVSVNLSVRLSSSTNQPLNSRQLMKSKIQYIPINKMVDKVIIFGKIVVCGQVVKIQQNKRIKVSEDRIGDQYFHTISHIVENPLTTSYIISSEERFSKFMVAASYQYEIKFGCGTKLCNSYGQKSEISAVADLGQYCAKRISDGAIIKPQILMGAISLVSRTACGQVLDMLSSPDAAMTSDGVLIAPIKFVVSSIVSCTKIAQNPKRIDLLTGPNCFDGNELTMTNLLLNKQRHNNFLPSQRLQHAFNLMEYKGTKLRFLFNRDYENNDKVLFQ